MCVCGGIRMYIQVPTDGRRGYLILGLGAELRDLYVFLPTEPFLQSLSFSTFSP